MSGHTIEIAGAGPAGLAAAIVLARQGFQVRVREQQATVGSRFNDDLQGFENWTSEGDYFDELKAWGIEPTWWQRPVAQCDIIDSSERQTQVRSSAKPIFYLVRRGPQHPDSLDNALLRQAQDLGVEVNFGQKAAPSAVRIFAGGPKGRPFGILRGLTFPLEHPDLLSTIFSERLAPGGYACLLVAGGHASLATVVFRDFRDVKRRLRLAVEAFEGRYGIKVPGDAHGWGGYGCFSVPDTCVRGQTLWAGEAAGFQDALFGFGLRAAVVSGALAACSIAHGSSYEEAWRARLMPYLKASQVNRAVYDRLGRVAEKGFMGLLKVVPDGNTVLRHMFSYSPLHRLASVLT